MVDFNLPFTHDSGQYLTLLSNSHLKLSINNKEFLPDTIYEVVAKIVREVLTQPSTGLLSFAILSALWTFSKSMDFLQKAFNKAYGVAKIEELSHTS